MDAIVIGAGVIGLTTAIRLLEAGFSVRTISRQPIEETTSIIAGAVWYPYLASGDRIQSWAAESLQTYEKMSRDAPEAGIDPLSLMELHEAETPDPWWRDRVTDFRRLTSSELRAGCSDGWQARVYRIEPLLFLTWLLGRFDSLGGEMHFFPAGVTQLQSLAGPDRMVVNCSGLGARTLVPDPLMSAVRGVVLRVRNPGLEHGWIMDRQSEQPCYIFPRRNDCILGGTADAGIESTEVEESIRERILERCTRLEPQLRDAQIYGYAVGMRPCRDSVRLESEVSQNGGLIVHNYGHGGNGFTLAWGCAEEVVERAINHRSDASSGCP